MKKLIFPLMLIFVFASCKKVDIPQKSSENPLLMKFNNEFEVPPFDQIKPEHFIPAFEQAMKDHDAEILQIVEIKSIPDFQNTIKAYEKSGRQLYFIEMIFNNLKNTDTNDQMQKIANEMSPKLSAHYDNIKLNERLFGKIKDVYNQKDKLNLTAEQTTLLTEIYKSFEAGGANLPAEKKERLKEINQQLSTLNLKFEENLLAENNNFKLIIDNKNDLAGLPQDVIAVAAKKAKDEKMDGKWIFTLHKPSLIPFIQFSENRELRKKMFNAYANMCNNNDKFDNKKIIIETVNLRLEKAKLFGFKNFAEYVLDNKMAKNPQNVFNLLDKVWQPAVLAAEKDLNEFQKIVDNEKGGFKIEPWDWFFYAEKLRKQKFDLNDEELKPYFELENTLNGLFSTVNKLYGLQITELKNIPVYNPEVRAYQIKDADGSHIGILYMDFFTRPSKSSGAWMTEFRGEYKQDGKRVAPVISTCFNFSKPADGMPSLLNFDELTTLYHEFGHALHGLLANTTYLYLSGTNVKRDFVELPSQIMENWATERESLKMFAKHYKTGEAIPDALIDKIEKSSHFNQGFAAVEYLAASYLDMNWHMISDKFNGDVNAFETEAMKKAGLPDKIIPRYRSPYFAHVFSGGYAVGYYSYIWAEVLDADAFDAFTQNGIFDKKTADLFRKNILEKGGTEDPMALYKAFRGSEPSTNPLLKRKGFLN